MKRRDFLAAGCACGLCTISGRGLAQTDWEQPARFARPNLASDEGGLWSMMDREETKLRRSPFALRDPKLVGYLQDIACRLGGEHCPDVRVYLVRTPLFNASMAPNGMLQIWTGLLLRVDNEAQLAAIVGHEIGHYLGKHSVEQLRDIKSRSAFGQFLGLFGVAGAVGQLAVLASAFAYSREHERAADRIGVALMSKAGYQAAEASKVWENLLLELKARPGGDPTKNSPMFASHPPADERKEALARLAEAAPSGVTNEDKLQEMVKPYRREWLLEEVKRGQHEESIALLTRLAARAPAEADFLHARAEVYRLRSEGEDLNTALSDYQAALAAGNEPAETHRGLGMIYRARKQAAAARSSFQRYLELAPDAADYLMIKSYMEELGT